jgi:hypothetical protein
VQPGGIWPRRNWRLVEGALGDPGGVLENAAETRYEIGSVHGSTRLWFGFYLEMI